MEDDVTTRVLDEHRATKELDGHEDLPPHTHTHIESPAVRTMTLACSQDKSSIFTRNRLCEQEETNTAKTSCHDPVASSKNPVTRFASTPASAPEVLLRPISGPA